MPELIPHILQVTGAPAGGIRKHVHAILSGLPALKQSYACAASEGDAVFHSEFPGLSRKLGGRVLELPIAKRPAFSDVLNIVRLRRFVLENGVSIVHGHGAKGGLYARALSLLCGVRSVYTPHGGAMHAMFSWPEDAAYRLAERLLLPLTGFFVFESEYTAEAYARRVGRRPENSIVNYSGVDLPDLGAVAQKAVGLGYSPPPHATPDIGVFGILRRQKGQFAALEAAAELKRRGLGVKLHLFGDGPSRADLDSACAALGISYAVVFHGEVQDVHPHMWGMDMVLIPSVFESFGYVALEAFSVGRPVLASDTGGLREIVTDGETGLLFSRGGAADAIARLCGEPGLRERLVRNAFARLKAGFSPASMLSRLEGIYLKVAAERAGRGGAEE